MTFDEYIEAQYRHNAALARFYGSLAHYRRHYYQHIGQHEWLESLRDKTLSDVDTMRVAKLQVEHFHRHPKVLPSILREYALTYGITFSVLISSLSEEVWCLALTSTKTH